jgi:hypothetical protein
MMTVLRLIGTVRKRRRFDQPGYGLIGRVTIFKSISRMLPSDYDEKEEVQNDSNEGKK